MRGLEIFVALLRNKANTKPVDVELFFKDHAKLISKMTKIETTSVALDLVNVSKKELLAMRNFFGFARKSAYSRDAGVDEENRQEQTSGYDLSPFSPFIEWSINFCEAAIIDLKLAKLEAEVADFELKIERAQLQITRYDTIFRQVQDHDFASFFTKSMNDMENRVQVVRGIVELDRTQAEQYQQNFQKFEGLYFKEFISIVQD